MIVHFSATLTLNSVPTVRHILDIEESMRELLRALCHQREDTLAIASGRVNGETMTVRFTAELELLAVASGTHAAEIESAIRVDLRRLRCFAADELTVEWNEVRKGNCREATTAAALEKIA